MATTNPLLSKVDESIFEDAANSPSPFNVLMESRSLFELGQFFQSLSHISTLPSGDNHPVIVIPGFLTDDKYTSLMRWFLKKKNYDVRPWHQGVNLSFKLRYIQNLQKQIYQINNNTGKKVSLVGWSLGGMYARYASHTMPEYIRQVITLGTPFSRQMNSTLVTRFFELINRQKFSDFHPDIINKIIQPLPVASTSIYSKLDGVIAWECSICPTPHNNHEHIEIDSSHTGLTHNPASLYAIADRLALSENDWQPFENSGIKQYLKTIKRPKIIPKSLLGTFNSASFTELKTTIQTLHKLYEELKIPNSRLNT